MINTFPKRETDKMGTISYNGKLYFVIESSEHFYVVEEGESGGIEVIPRHIAPTEDSDLVDYILDELHDKLSHVYSVVKLDVYRKALQTEIDQCNDLQVCEVCGRGENSDMIRFKVIDKAFYSCGLHADAVGKIAEEYDRNHQR